MEERIVHKSIQCTLHEINQGGREGTDTRLIKLAVQ